MEITPLQPTAVQVIQGYAKGGFLVSDRQYQGAILVFPDKIEAWAATDVGAIDIGSLSPVTDASPAIEVLLIGTGARMALLGSALRAGIRAYGIAVETMDTGAACRTYNLLMSENRRVAAALLPIS